jgi:type II secretory pathway component PulJ
MSMTEEVVEQDQTVVTGTDTTQQSETVTDKGTEQSAGATDTQQTVAETDEQKNERVQREAAEKAEKRSRGVQKRIDELTADKHSLARQLSEALALAKQAGETRQAKPTVEGEPTQGADESLADFLVRRAVHVAEQKATAIVEQKTKASQEATQRTEAQKAEVAVEREYQARQKEAATKIPDFMETMEDADIAVPTPVYNMIRRLPEGPVIAYHMAKKPELAQQFFQHPPEMHGVLLGQLAATLKAPQKTTTAPAPGKTVASKAGSDNEPPSDPEKYRAWADKHLT